MTLQLCNIRCTKKIEKSGSGTGSPDFAAANPVPDPVEKTGSGTSLSTMFASVECAGFVSQLHVKVFATTTL